MPPMRSRAHPSLDAVCALVAAQAVFGSGVLAQTQFEELRRRHLPFDVDPTAAVAVGDVDGDGDLDIVCANGDYRGAQQNRLYINDGTGVLTDATATQLPVISDSTSSVALGDVDGDGDLDIVSGNRGYPAQQNRLYVNDGTGRFTDTTAMQLPLDSDSTYSVALGDVDGDGDIDIVCGNIGQNRLYLNNGAGGFTDFTTARMPRDIDGTSSVALGDVDGDGDLDIVCGNISLPGQQNRLYVNNGTGAFTDATATQMPAVTDITSVVVLGDVDGDGDLDIVCGNYRGQQNRLYLNDGTGVFNDVTATRLPADSDRTQSLAFGDVDSDGDLDIISGNRGQNRLYVNDGTGVFTDATSTQMPAVRDLTSSVALGDVDGDGDLDIVSGSSDGRQNHLHVNNGTGGFIDASTSQIPVDNDATPSVALGDVDGDGDLDIVCGNGGGVGQQNRLYLNNDTGQFIDATATQMPVDNEDTQSVALGDVDGDGDLDIVCANYTLLGQQNRLYLNDGTGRFTDASATQMPVDSDRTSSVALGDVDGDGDLDIVFGNVRTILSPAQANRLYVNDGTGTFTNASFGQFPVDSDVTYSVALGDVDGDGDLDIVCGNSRQDRLYVNDGRGMFTAARMPVVRETTNSVALGDIDGDGDLDVLCGSSRQQNRLYVNDGAGVFTEATASQLPADRDATFAVAFGDVDGDGDLDIVNGNSGYPGQQNRLYINDGTGRFTDTTAMQIPVDSAGTTAVALGDVDGDGDLEIVCGNGYFGTGQQNHLYINLRRQLHAPFLLRAGAPYTLRAHVRFRVPGASAVVLPYVATRTRPTNLGRLGVFRLDTATMIPLPLFLVRQAEGSGSLTVPVPNDPNLLGTTFYSQALVIEQPGEARLTNFTADLALR